MDILFILTSVNKIALIAFVITFFLIVFEIYQIAKQRKKKDKPVIPDYDSKKKYRPVITARPSMQKNEKKVNFVKPNNSLIVLLILVVFLLVSIYEARIFLTPKKKLPSTSQSLNQLQVSSSDGIRIYDENWQEITTRDFKRIVNGVTIFIGVETVKGGFIDKARIRINKSIWEKSDETNLFKAKDRVFYREYQVATNESQLRIEAQLHNPKKGWLE